MQWPKAVKAVFHALVMETRLVSSGPLVSSSEMSSAKVVPALVLRLPSDTVSTVFANHSSVWRVVEV